MSAPYLEPKQFENIFKNHLKITNYSQSIESLFSVRNRQKINFKPDYQRNYIWDLNKATYFIESIILGTEIPPLILFKNEEGREIIDGRQRFETISLFKENKIKLKRKGFSILKFLENLSFEDIPDDIRDYFLESNLRIIEFTVINESKLNTVLQDKIKKEIFSRYNSGITPLKKSEIDNAIYDNDSLSNIFKKNLDLNTNLYKKITTLFFKDSNTAKANIANIMQFIRKNTILHLVPITYHAAGKKNEIFEKLYEQFTDGQPDHNYLFESFCQKIDIIYNFHNTLQENKPNTLFYQCFLWIINVLENENIDLSIFKKSSIGEELFQY